MVGTSKLKDVDCNDPQYAAVTVPYKLAHVKYENIYYY